MRRVGVLAMTLAVASSAVAGPRHSGQARVTVLIPKVMAASAVEPVQPRPASASLSSAIAHRDVAATVIDLQGVAPFQVYAALAATDRAPDGLVTLAGVAGGSVALAALASGPQPLAQGVRAAHLEVSCSSARLAQADAPVEVVVTSIADF